MTEGFENGEGYKDLAARVQDEFELADSWRAETIARTEVIGSSNFASFNAYEQSGVVPGKQWVSTLDDRVRDSHEALNGEIVPIDEPFKIGSAAAFHPGGFGVAAEDINCRCTIAPVVDESEIKDAAALAIEWKRFDAKAIRWEKQATKALRRAFDKQKDKALERLLSVAG